MVGALAHLLAGSFAHLICAVGNRRLELQSIAASAAVHISGSPAAVGMSARRPDRLTGDEQTRADEMALLNRGLDAPVTSACIADRCEAAIEHGPKSCGRPSREERERHRFEKADIDLTVNNVDMAIDQSRH